MARYYKLGKSASSFYDPTSQLSLVSKSQIVELAEEKAKLSKYLKIAESNGHIVIATEEEYKDYKNPSEAPIGEDEDLDKKEDEDLDKKEDGENDKDKKEDGEDDEDLTKTELIDLLKESGKFNKAEKKELVNKSLEELKELHESLK